MDDSETIVSSERSPIDLVVDDLTRMSKWFNDDVYYSRLALEKIVSHFHRANYLVYLGVVSNEIGYSLNRTQSMFDALVVGGIIRELSGEEKQSKHAGINDAIYVLVGRAHQNKANWLLSRTIHYNKWGS